MSVWEDLTVCDFLDIIDSWKLFGLGKMGFKAQTCWTDLLAFWGVWNRSRIINFGPDRLFFPVFPSPASEYFPNLKQLHLTNPKHSERHAWANSADYDLMPQSVASDQGLHCLSLIQQYCRYLTLFLLNQDMPCLCKQCRSRSVGFWRSQLIWICTVCH